MTPLIALDPPALHAALSRHPAGLLVLFSARWCAPCQTYKPIVERVASGTVEILLVDTDTSRELSVEFGVRSVPTLVCFAQGQVVAKRSGTMRESQLRALLEDVGLTSQRAPASAGTREATGVRGLG